MQLESPSTHPRRELRAALQILAARAQSRLTEVGGVGVTLMVADEPVFVASNGFTESVDAVQYGFGEGPCVTAVETRVPVWSGSIGAGEDRWPRFVEQTVPLGLGSVLSTPVLASGTAVGSINLYARELATFGDPDLALVGRAEALVADELRALNLQVLAGAALDAVADALRDRALVDVAVGYLMDRHALAHPEARLLLGRLAERDGVSEVVTARSVIDA